MSVYMFTPFRGHLSAALVKKIERKFPRVAVVNYTEPRGEKRGWFAGPNRGEPFDRDLAREVGEFARANARGKDRAILGCDDVDQHPGEEPGERLAREKREFEARLRSNR